MRYMFDSVTMADIPATVNEWIPPPVIACYADGKYRNIEEAWRRFPRCRIITIDVFGNERGGLAQVLDIERGDATPNQFHEWARARANKGVSRPGCYGTIGTCIEVCRLAPFGVVTDCWVANWTGRPNHPVIARGNVVAVQYASPKQGSGGHYDRSIIWDDSWHRSR